MRLSPAVKTIAICSVFALIAGSAAVSHAATSSPSSTALTSAQQEALNNSIAQSQQAAQQAVMQAMQQQSGVQYPNQQQPWMNGSQDPNAQNAILSQLLGQQQSQKKQQTQAELDSKLQDRDSGAYKADQLAKKAKLEDQTRKFIDQQEKESVQLFDEQPPPPEIEELQDIALIHGKDGGFADDLVSGEASLDMRRDSMREAALSYGARGGLAKRSYQIMERLNDYAPVLDHVFDFRQLLIKAPSGMLIEPPIVKESLRSTIINEDGAEAAVADQVLKINKQAKIVTAPRDWRQYLVMTYSSEIPPPPRVLWPKTKEEQTEWDEWIRQGWDAGYTQGDDIFDMNVNQMTADYNGMVRYRMLLAEGKISKPYAMQEDRGITGGGNEMRVGDRALRITGPSEFLTGADLWKPASR